MAQLALGAYEAIAAANEDWMSAIRRGDAADLVALYAEDGQLLAPGGEFLRGKPEIQAYWQSRMDASVQQAELEMLDLEVYDKLDPETYGTLALERTLYTMRDEHGRIVDEGKYVLLWARVNGHWELHRDILNSSPSSPTS